MKNKTNKKMEETMTCGSKGCGGACGGAVYGLGLVGAAVYFVSNAAGIGAGIIGFLKALVWPAYLVYGLFTLLGN